jgi:glycine cleavage system H lipoate-binding protein
MDFLPTKGIEYLIAIAYLVLLVPLGWLLSRTGPRTAAAVAAPAAMRSWFRVPETLHFHRGHAWAAPEGGGVFRVGIDDFAQRLLGRPDALALPPAGERVEQGAPGPRLTIGGADIRMLSPVGGEVVETNPEVLREPGLVCADPYGRGWLMKVRVPEARAALSNLLTGKLAQAWMDDAAEGLSRLMGPSLGPVLQDGGVPVSGFARELSPAGWPRMAEELLLAA